MGSGINCFWPISKTEMLIYQSKANLDGKIGLFGKFTHLSNQEIKKMLVRDFLGVRIPCSILVHDLQHLSLKSKSAAVFSFRQGK